MFICDMQTPFHHIVSAVRPAMVKFVMPSSGSNQRKTVAICFKKQAKTIDAVPGSYSAARIYDVQVLIMTSTGAQDIRFSLWGSDELRQNHPNVGETYIVHGVTIKPGNFRLQQDPAQLLRIIDI